MKRIIPATVVLIILAGAALLTHGDETMAVAGAALREACMGALHDGVRTADLGGYSTTTAFTDEVIARVRKTLSLGV